MSDSDNEDFLSRLMIFDKAVEQTDEWWLSPDKENGVRSRLAHEGMGGLGIDRVVNQINAARFKQYKGEEPKREMAYMNPMGGWFR